MVFPPVEPPRTPWLLDSARAEPGEDLVAAGATKVRVLEAPNHYAIAMIDPEGNEFDLN